MTCCEYPQPMSLGATSVCGNCGADLLAEDPEVARIQRNMDLLGGLTDDPFADELKATA